MDEEAMTPVASHERTVAKRARRSRVDSTRDRRQLDLSDDLGRSLRDARCLALAQPDREQHDGNDPANQE